MTGYYTAYYSKCTIVFFINYFLLCKIYNYSNNEINLCVNYNNSTFKSNVAKTQVKMS